MTRSNIAIWMQCAIFLALGTVFGCNAFRQGTQPDDMSAEEHRAEAFRHKQLEQQHAAHYDPEASTPVPYSYDDLRDDYYWETETYNPTAHHLDSAERHARHARAHEGAAMALEEFERDQCGAFPEETRAACPLLGQVESVEDVYGGVRIRFDESVDVNAAMAHMRCHLAFAAARGRVGMDACPLYVRGARVTRVKRSSTVDITVDDESSVTELRKRAREHLSITFER